jgi:hypothetical protein
MRPSTPSAAFPVGSSSSKGDPMILSKVRDPRLITIRRGGTLTDAHHRLLALWAAACAAHVLHHFEKVRPDDGRPRAAIDAAHAWTRGEMTMMQARQIAFAANAAAREAPDPAKFAALSAGQAAAVGHVAAHDLGAAAYAIRAAQAAAADAERDQAGHRECAWQRQQLPDEVRALVLDDQKKRNAICWFVFD